jgi:GT2 family glycosyltransferase
MDNPLISIVILNWNGEDLLENCLNSVLNSSYKQIEIIIVDNYSTDSSLKVLEKYTSRIHLILNNENKGFAGGMNSGIKHARGKYIATLNNDVVVDPDWLNRPIELLESDTTIGIISCRQMVYNESDIIDVLYSAPTPHLLPKPVGSNKKYSAHPEFHTEKVVFGASGASVIYRKQLLARYGGFDERFFAYHEESDLQTRAHRDGWKCVYVPSAIVYHMGSRSFGKLSRTFHYYHERNRWWYIVKNYSFLNILTHFPYLFFMELRLIRVIFFKSKCPDVYLKARIDAIKGLINYNFFRKTNKSRSSLICKIL